ncbi:MAG: endopeptidase La [Armatimonadetes bacterium]|nr:endopeptidase La [Armatimonadota bacterium]
MAHKSVPLKGLVGSAWILPIRDQVMMPGAILTLQITRPASEAAIQESIASDRLLLAITQQDSSHEDPTPENLFAIGTLAEVIHTVPMPDGSTRLVLKGLRRCGVIESPTGPAPRQAKYREIADVVPTDSGIEAYSRLLKQTFTRIAGRNEQIPTESIEGVSLAANALTTAFLITHFLPCPTEQKQEVLEIAELETLLEHVVSMCKREEALLDAQDDIRNRVEGDISQVQRQFFLREQLRAIQQELGIKGPFTEECESYRDAIENNVPEPARTQALIELRKLEQATESSPDIHVTRNYLQTLMRIPWSDSVEEEIDIAEAEARLDQAHFGLSGVKERIIEFLAVKKLRGSTKGAVLCFVGPPGVGKTSFARSIAKVMNRRCGHIALGGVRDEAEIRGHRRTYVGARPGRIVQAILEAGRMNPVLVLDEVDKLCQGIGGDPTSALLELLDPSQNSQFVDHFLEVPMDLSNVLFIVTANVLDSIPSALLDRMEIIEFSGYSEEERKAIAVQYVIPEVRETSGLGSNFPALGSDALLALVRDYSRESGVRSLSREIARLGRKLAKQTALGHAIPKELSRADLSDLLGLPQIPVSELTEDEEVGIVNGLVVCGYGGDHMQVEVSLTKPVGSELKLTLTGSIGPVMQESVQTALTCVRSLLDTKGIDSRFDVHVHLPQAAIPKDGPSAGLTVAVALFSAFSGRAVQPKVAMTGELNLRGHTLAVGGLREKLLAAKRYGYERVLIPAVQATELANFPKEIVQGVDVEPVANLTEALKFAIAQAQTVNIL